ncbi:DNA-binding protein [Streptomyces sp. NPDC008061]|uniref:DNA-binding protein n=1 Tax=Streptomyces sp. NPDC008061 TaxID=3364805 RepID=UPI0036F0003F
MFPNTQALAERRWRGTGPDYVKTKPGRSGRVFYRESAVERWLDALTVPGGRIAA